MVNTSVEVYLSGSRVLMTTPEVAVSELVLLLLSALLEFTFVFAFKFAFVLVAG